METAFFKNIENLDDGLCKEIASHLSEFWIKNKGFHTKTLQKRLSSFLRSEKIKALCSSPIDEDVRVELKNTPFFCFFPTSCLTEEYLHFAIVTRRNHACIFVDCSLKNHTVVVTSHLCTELVDGKIKEKSYLTSASGRNFVTIQKLYTTNDGVAFEIMEANNFDSVVLWNYDT